MIPIDRKMKNAILKLTNSYSEEIFYKSDTRELILVHDGISRQASVPVPVSPEEVIDSLARLSEMNLIKLHSLSGDCYFSITPELKHRKAFLWDHFSKRFFGGLVSGAAITILAEVALHFIFGVL